MDPTLVIHFQNLKTIGPYYIDKKMIQKFNKLLTFSFVVYLALLFHFVHERKILQSPKKD